jgi:peptidoglycan-associated lipoprotein
VISTPIRSRAAPRRDLSALPGAPLVLALLLAGCASTQPQPEPQTLGAGLPPPLPLNAAPSVADTARTEPARPTYRGPWEDPANPLYRRTIYFDYDSTEIKPQFLDVIRTHSTYLGTTKGQRVTLEGNTDERGTREYNLALGDRRAESVRQLMVAEGVGADQMATLSYGEEKPADPGHSDAAWRLNRRVIIHY